MKKLVLSFAVVVLTTMLATAQLKVVPGNNVSIGFSWLSGQSEKLAVLGRSYFIEPPAMSGLSIGNYVWNGWFNATSIIPQWNSSTLLGTPTERFFEIYATNVHYMNFYNLSDRNLKTNNLSSG
jgi:hypothetical protein